MTIQIPYMDFIETPNPNHKTRKWLVRNHENQTYLGEIKWFTNWRKYVFFPEYNTIFDNSCLNKISEFLVHVKQEHDAELNKQ